MFYIQENKVKCQLVTSFFKVITKKKKGVCKQINFKYLIVFLA